MDYPEHRRAQARLLIRNPDGTPVANRPVQIDQVSHQFLLGCGAADAVAIMKARNVKRLALLEERIRKSLRLFNYATLPFYWGNYESSEGETACAETMKAARWLRDHGVTVKGHPLCWHNISPPWLSRYDSGEVLRRQLDRIHREVSTYRGTIDVWDVINEAVVMPAFDRDGNAVARICREKGRIALAREAFAAARESNPDALLLINDYNTGPKYEHLLEELLEGGVPIGAIGIQSHQHQGYWGVEKLNDVLERFSRFGLPIHFTENSLISGDPVSASIKDLSDWHVASWPSTPEGEERQARELAEMADILFRHPLVAAFTTWELNDGGWLKAPSGLLRADNSEKPAYSALEKMIHGAWETHETLTTDDKGYLSFRGFKGGYAIRADGKTAGFSLDSPTDIVVQLEKEKKTCGILAGKSDFRGSDPVSVRRQRFQVGIDVLLSRIGRPR